MHVTRWMNLKSKDQGQDEKGAAEDEMVGWHHRLYGHEFEQTQRSSEGQRSLACCSSWLWRVRHNLVTEQQQMQYLQTDRFYFHSYLRLALW